MAKPLKVKTFSLSSEQDEIKLEKFLSSVTVNYIVGYDSKVLVVYEKK